HRPVQPGPGRAHRGAQHRQGFPGARLVALDERADHHETAVAGPVGQRTAQRGGLHLLGCALGVGARYGAVYDAAAGVLRRAQRALPGPAGALLPVRLLAAAADLAPRLGGVRALPGRRLLRHHDLVDERDVHLGAEDLSGQLDIRPALAGRRYNTDRGHFAAHWIASLAGASLASEGVSSPPGHRNGAWGASCGVRPGACGAHRLLVNGWGLTSPP